MTKTATKTLSFAIMIISWLLTLFIIIDVDFMGYRKLQEIAVFVLFSFLSIGIIGFIFNSSKLMLNQFACAAMLCIYLKSASNSALQLPEINQSTHFSVAHINLSSVESGYEEFIEEIKSREIDIISFQEFKPDWAPILQSMLTEIFPFKVENVRIDLFGMSIYSKFPIDQKDTIIIDNKPFLEAKIDVDKSRKIHLSNPLILPSIDAQMDNTQEIQMVKTAEHISTQDGPKVVMGDFNMVYWSSRIRDFRNTTGLMNSRRDISQSVLSIPYDHIFYSKDLECTKFFDLVDDNGTRLGIQADFQFTENSQ